MSASRGGAVTRYVLDRVGRLAQVLAETGAAGNITAEYVYGLGLISRIDGKGRARYYHYDSRGSTIALTDAGGQITEAYAYDPFGRPISAAVSDNRFRYLGRHGVIDEQNGLLYIRARYYSTQRGRFITKDPTTGRDSDSQSLNRYVYALNNPIRLIDISGLSAQETSGTTPALATSDSILSHNICISPETSGLETEGSSPPPVTATKSSGIVSDILSSVVSSVLNAIPVIVQIHFEGAGAATSVGGSSAVGVGLDVVPVVVESLNTEVSSAKAFDRMLPEYVQELRDGNSMYDVVNYAWSTNYRFGYARSVIENKIIEEANREGVEVAQ
jgi:RHS repeat-associated protein